MPFFSVIIPTYNRKDLVINSIRSVLNQEFEDYELIIIDDGSQDRTQPFVQENFASERRLKYFYKENAERGAARNYGWKRAQGDFITFLDSDDLMHPDHLAVLHQYILKNPEVEFFATKYDFKIGENRGPAKDILDIKESTYNFEIFLKGNFLACNICFNRKSQGIQPFEEDPQYAIMEDWMFLLQNLESKQLLIIDRITLTMLDHEDRSMRKDNHDIIKKKLSATERIDINLKLTKKSI